MNSEKKFIIIAAAMIAAGGCKAAVTDDATQEATFDKAVNSQFEKYYHGNGISVIRDITTGCEYLGYYGEYISPRLDSNGNPICGKSNGRISGEIEGKAN